MKRNKDIDKDSLNEVIHLSKKLLRVFYIITIVGIFLGVSLALMQIKVIPFIGGILKVISPLFIGFILAWLFYPIHRKLLDKGVNKVLSAVIIFFTLIALIIMFIYIFVPVLYRQVNELVSFVPKVLTGVSTFITNTFNKFDIAGIDFNSIKNSLITAGEELIFNITSSLPNGFINIVKGLISAFGTILISFVVGIYVLIDFDNISVNVYKLVPKRHREDAIKLFKSIGESARKVVNGTFLVAYMVCVCDTIGFALVGLNASVLFGIFCGLTDLIPYIGPYIGGIAAVVVGFTQGTAVGIGALLVAVLVQFLESYILQPMIMSKAMKLHPVLIIIGLLLFGHFFGIVGMVLATPCMSIIKVIISYIVEKKKELEIEL